MPFLLHALGGLGGRTAPLEVLLAPQEETLAVCTTYKLPDIALVVPPWTFLGPPAEWQVCPPQGSAEASSAGGLSRLSILPPSTLWWLHAGTSHVVLPCNVGYLLPIGIGFQGRALHPLFSPFL